MSASQCSTYLVKEILHQVCNAYIVEMPMSQQKFLEVLEFGNGVVTVPHCLTTLFPLDTWNSNKHHTLLYTSHTFSTTSIQHVTIPKTN